MSTNSYTDTYTMDLVGNRLTKTHMQGGQTLTSTYTYNGNDQLTNESGSGSSTYSTSYSYDGNGSLTSVSRTGSGAETDSYGYDLQNRMTSANISRTENGTAVTIAATYGYDDSGFRANSAVTTTIGSGSPTTTMTQFLVDVDNPTGYTQVLEEHTLGAGTPSMSYLTGLSVFGQTNGSPVTNYLMPDGQGSTRLVTDASGNIATHYAFDAYGNLLIVPIGVVNPPVTKILYTGQLFDVNLLQYYLRARFFNPASGRFGELDPYPGHVSDPGSLHRYIYAADNPNAFFDPSGLNNVPGDVYQRVGTKVHWIFSIYVFLLRRSQLPGAWLTTILPDQFPAGAPGWNLKPDLVDTSEKTYFDLKPVTWANDANKLADLNFQMGSYDDALKPHGYRRGQAADLTFGLPKMPVGIVRDQGNRYLVTLRPASPSLRGNVDGRGVLWYELDPIREPEDDDPESVPIPNILAIPEEVVRDISVFKLAPKGGEPGLDTDWIPLVASAIGVRFLLYRLAWWGTTTTQAGNQLDQQVGIATSTFTGIAA